MGDTNSQAPICAKGSVPQPARQATSALISRQSRNVIRYLLSRLKRAHPCFGLIDSELSLGGMTALPQRKT